MKDNAIILTAGLLEYSISKTAHGLIRNSSRYNIVGVIDKNAPGKDAGLVVDNTSRGILVYGSLSDFLDSSPVKASYAIVGVALPGGKLTEEMTQEVTSAIRAGISVVSGLHDFLSEIPEIEALAAEYGVELTDIRKPRPKHLLKFWSGEIMQVTAPVIAVLGTDCNLGKRTTAVLITEEMKRRDYSAYMVFTGQTGWLQGNEYGFILDATYNDFISGELENAVVTCFREKSPDFIFLEGQSALSNPSGPCGAEYLLSAQCKGTILQHSPARIYYKGQEQTGIRISIDRDIDLIRLYGSEVIAITLNTRGLSLTESLAYKEEYIKKYKVPVILPIEEGVGKLANAVIDFSKKTTKAAAL